MTTRQYAVNLILSSLLAVVILAVGAPRETGVPSPSLTIDCRYENPELKAYADRIPSCLP